MEISRDGKLVTGFHVLKFQVDSVDPANDLLALIESGPQHIAELIAAMIEGKQELEVHIVALTGFGNILRQKAEVDHAHGMPLITRYKAMHLSIIDQYNVTGFYLEVFIFNMDNAHSVIYITDLEVIMVIGCQGMQIGKRGRVDLDGKVVIEFTNVLPIG